MSTPPIARRVALRYRRRTVHGATKVEYSAAGYIDAMAVTRLLEPSYGPLLKLTFRPSLQGKPMAVPFDAMTPKDQLVCGRVIIHTTVAANSIMSWGEVVVDDVEVPF